MHEVRGTIRGLFLLPLLPLPLLRLLVLKDVQEETTAPKALRVKS